MRVGVYYSNSDVRVEDRPMPEVGPGDLLLKVMASGICGSDVMEWYRLPKAPLVLGHEIAGEIVAIGAGVKGLSAGQRIAAFHHVPCNTCHYCLNGHHTICDTFRRTHFYPGGFAEFAVLSELEVDRGVYPLPDDISYEEGAFVEPVACVMRGLRMGALRPAQTVLIIGAGIAGLLQVQVARALGAARVIATDLVDYRLAAAKSLGADAVFTAGADLPGELRRLNGNLLADLVVVSTGAPAALALACRSVERGGTILLFAPPPPDREMPVPLNDLWTDEVSLITSYSGSPADARAAADLIFTRRIDVRPMITHRLPISEIGQGFRLVAEAKHSIKVMIEPHGPEGTGKARQ